MKPKHPPKISKQKLLLCEGRDEVNFFSALLAHLRRADIQVEDVGGKSFFAPNIAALVVDPLFPQLTGLLIVRDADCTVDGAGFTPTWQSVAGTLRHNSIPVPAAQGVFVPGPPRVAVFIMPDGTSDGMLETLCWGAVQTDSAAPCVLAYFDCLNAAKVAGIPHLPRNRDKAFTRVFLASRPEPDKRLGEAAQAGYWPWSDPAFAPLIDVLRQL